MARRIELFRGSVLKMAGSLLSSVLAALGVSSCGGTEVAGIPCYGVPSVEFTVNGFTRTARDSSAIPGIRVTLSTIASGDTSVVDSSFTTEIGSYGIIFVQEGDVDYEDYYLHIQADDVDSFFNRWYDSADTLIPITPDSVLDGLVRIEGLTFYMEEKL